MNASHSVRGLQGMVTVLESEIKRLTCELARKETMRRKYQANLKTLRRLYDDIGSHPFAQAPVLAINSACYRQHMTALIAAQEVALARYEQDLFRTRERLHAKERKCEIWRRELKHHARALVQDRARHAQTAGDESAIQVWRRSTRANDMPQSSGAKPVY